MICAILPKFGQFFRKGMFFLCYGQKLYKGLHHFEVLFLHKASATLNSALTSSIDLLVFARAGG